MKYNLSFVENPVKGKQPFIGPFLFVLTYLLSLMIVVSLLMIWMEVKPASQPMDWMS